MAIMDELMSSLEEAETLLRNEEKAMSLCAMVLQGLSEDIPDRDAFMELLVTNGFVDFIIEYFEKNPNMSSVCKCKLAQTVAELAKHESCREACTDEVLITTLVRLLQEPEHTVVTQAARAVGNICYDNDEARSLFEETKGISVVISLIDELYNQRITVKDSGVDETHLMAVLCGCLLNGANTNERALETVIQMEVPDLLIKILKRYLPLSEDVVLHALLLLHCIADSDAGENSLTKEVLCQLIELLENDMSENSMEALLDFLLNLSEDDHTKAEMTALNLPLKIISLLNKQARTTSVAKMLLDLMTLLLTEDTSMKMMYDNGSGKVYKECLNWISSNDSSKQRSGLLAIGNFARNDENCLKLVQDKVHQGLIAVAEENMSVDGDLRMQHACLSALRNLAIPLSNKPILLECGLLEVLTKMSQVEAYPVVFKLVGTMRMLIDKQEEAAKSLGTNQQFLKRLVQWCGVEEHSGVKGESIRLLASIVKNAKSANVSRTVLESDGLQLLVKMVYCEHYIMRNEALVALILLVGHCCPFSVESTTTNCDLAAALHSFFTNTNANEQLPSETLMNAFSLLDLIRRKDAKLWNSVFEQISEDLKSLAVDSAISDQVKSRIAIFLE